MQVKIKKLGGGVFEVELDLEAPVSAAKEAIAAAQSGFENGIRLVFSGKVLEDDKILGSYGIDKKPFLVALPQKATAKAPAPAPTPAAAPATGTATAAAADAGGSSSPAPAPAPATATATPASSGGDSGVLSGDALEAKIQEMSSMGFPLDQVRAAMRAAFNDHARAMTYLLDGIPEGVGSAPPAPPAPTMGGGSSPAQGGGGPSPLDALRGIPDFDRIRASVQADPTALPQVIALLAQQSPAIGAWIQAHPEEFVNFMNEPLGGGGDGVGAPGAPAGGGIPGLPPGFNPQLLGALIANLPEEAMATMATSMGMNPEQLRTVGAALAAGGAQGGAPPGARVVRLTQEEAASVNMLEGLGFSRQRALEAFLICDKNQEAAANYLFTNPE